MSIPTPINIVQPSSSGVAKSPNSSPTTSFVGSGTYSHPASPTASSGCIPTSPFGSSPQAPGRRVKVIGNYDLGRTIGKGQFGKVKIARHVLTVKIIRKLMLDEGTMKLVRREINIMKLLRHPHIIRLYEIMETEKTLFLIMEYASGGEVLDFIVAHGRLQENLAKRFFAQVVAALEFCHARYVVHRDLKAENMLLDSDLSIKIIDFGLSNHFIPGQMMKTFCGSPTYAAPELIQKKEYCGPEADVWSLGVVLYVFVCGALPFNGHDFLSLFTKILNCDYHIPEHVSPDCRSLIQRMLVVNPDFRATLDDVKNSRWLASEQATMGSISTLDLRPALDLNPDQLDDVILKHMELFGYSREAVSASIKANQCNAAAATYILLLEKKTKMEASPTRTPSSGQLPGVRAQQQQRKPGGPPQQGGGSRRGHRRTQTADNPIIIERDAYGNPSVHVPTHAQSHREQQQQNYMLQQQQAQAAQEKQAQAAQAQAQQAQQAQQQQLYYYQQQIQNQLQLLQQQQGGGASGVSPQQQVQSQPVSVSGSTATKGTGTTSIYLIPKNPQQAAAVIANSAPASLPLPTVAVTTSPSPTFSSPSAAPTTSVAVSSQGHRRTRSIETNQYSAIGSDMDTSSPRTLLQQQQAIQVHEKLQHHRRTSSGAGGQPAYDKPPLYPTVIASSSPASSPATSHAPSQTGALHPPSLVVTVATPTSSPPIGHAAPPGTGSGGKGSHRRTMSIATTPNHSRDRDRRAENAREKEEEDNFFFIPSPASSSPHVSHHPHSPSPSSHPHPPLLKRTPSASKHSVASEVGDSTKLHTAQLPIPLHLLQEHPTIASVSGDLSPRSRSRPSSTDRVPESPRAIVVPPPDQSSRATAQLSNHDRATLALEAEEAAEKEMEKKEKSPSSSTTSSSSSSPTSSTSSALPPPTPPPAPAIAPAATQTSISSLISSLKSWLIRKDSSDQQQALAGQTGQVTKEPRTVRSALTATSTKAPDAILAEIKRALQARGVRGKLTSPFCFECQERSAGSIISQSGSTGTTSLGTADTDFSTISSSTSSSDNRVHFEMEVCSLPGLTKMYYIRTKRIGGDWARYKTICRELIDEMKL